MEDTELISDHVCALGIVFFHAMYLCCQIHYAVTQEKLAAQSSSEEDLYYHHVVWCLYSPSCLGRFWESGILLLRG